MASAGRTPAPAAPGSPPCRPGRGLPEWATADGWFDGEGETERAQITARADRVIASLQETHGDDDVVALVSHGWFGNVLLSRLLGISEQAGAVEISNTAMVLVEDTGPEVPWDRTAVRINWMPHLSDDLITDSALHPGYGAERPDPSGRSARGRRPGCACCPAPRGCPTGLDRERLVAVEVDPVEGEVRCGVLAYQGSPRSRFHTCGLGLLKR